MSAMPAVAKKSVLHESGQIELAAMLIRMGARMQVLESETSLSYERLSRLYKEIVGKSPPKGQLPFSTEWFLTWQENVHSSLFLNIYEYLNKGATLEPAKCLCKAYALYREQVLAAKLDVLLSFTRAWRLRKFIEAKMLSRLPCKKCKGIFVADIYENPRHYHCGLCNPPARAGKGRASGSLLVHREEGGPDDAQESFRKQA